MRTSRQLRQLYTTSRKVGPGHALTRTGSRCVALSRQIPPSPRRRLVPRVHHGDLGARRRSGAGIAVVGIHGSGCCSQPCHPSGSRGRGHAEQRLLRPLTRHHRLDSNHRIGVAAGDGGCARGPRPGVPVPPRVSSHSRLVPPDPPTSAQRSRLALPPHLPDTPSQAFVGGGPGPPGRRGIRFRHRPPRPDPRAPRPDPLPRPGRRRIWRLRAARLVHRLCVRLCRRCGSPRCSLRGSHARPSPRPSPARARLPPPAAVLGTGSRRRGGAGGSPDAATAAHGGGSAVRRRPAHRRSGPDAERVLRERGWPR